MPLLLLLAGVPMASFAAANTFVGGAPSSAGCRRRVRGAAAGKRFLVSSGDHKEPSCGSLVLKAAKLLGSPTRFEASKLEVVFLGEEMGKHPPCTVSRAYALTHCDLTANLTPTVSNHISIDQVSYDIWSQYLCSQIVQLRRWKTKLQSDDVVAEWKMVKDETSLQLHCHVSGSNPLQDLAAEFRYHFFSKELPLVLQAVVHGDHNLFKEHPELMGMSF